MKIFVIFYLKSIMYLNINKWTIEPKILNKYT